MRINRDNLKFCNCAECGIELLGDRHKDLPWQTILAERLPQSVFERVNDRPYCLTCYLRIDNLRSVSRYYARPVNCKYVGEDSPWQQNAIKSWEDS